MIKQIVVSSFDAIDKYPSKCESRVYFKEKDIILKLYCTVDSAWKKIQKL